MLVKCQLQSLNTKLTFCTCMVDMFISRLLAIVYLIPFHCCTCEERLSKSYPSVHVEFQLASVLMVILESGIWESSRPTTEMIRVPRLVHEASIMWIGDDKEAPVGLDYRPKGVENVYISGGSLWPTGASWNPTPIMVAMATHLADTLEPKSA